MAFDLVGELGSALITGGVNKLFGDKGVSPRAAAYGSIKGKVQAARDFGLHPLFALGAGVSAGYPPQQVNAGTDQGIAEALSKMFDDKGESAAEAMARRESDARTQALVMEAERNRSMAQKTDAERAVLLSEATRAVQATNAQQDKLVLGASKPPKEVMRNPAMPDIHSRGQFSDAQDISDKYGDFIGEMYGITRRLGEMGMSLGSWLHEQTGEPAQKRRYKRNRRPGGSLLPNTVR